jgi:hypothetical protein
MEDEYSRYDEMWDPNADEYLMNSGATIIRSEIMLSEPMGRNRTIVRSDDS